jgi:hypothetical protein
MLAEVRDVFKEDGGQVETDVIEEHEMLVELAHIIDVWDDGDAELLTHDAHGKKLAYTRDADGIDLDEPGAFGLQVVFENHVVRHVFAEGQFHRGDGIGEGLVAGDIVGMRGFLDPEGLDFREPRADIKRLGQGPLLVGIDHDARVRTGDLANDAGAAEIAFRVLGANLEFHGGETGIDGTLAVFADLIVAIVKPNLRETEIIKILATSILLFIP